MRETDSGERGKRSGEKSKREILGREGEHQERESERFGGERESDQERV